MLLGGYRIDSAPGGSITLLSIRIQALKPSPAGDHKEYVFHLPGLTSLSLASPSVTREIVVAQVVPGILQVPSGIISPIHS